MARTDEVLEDLILIGRSSASPQQRIRATQRRIVGFLGEVEALAADAGMNGFAAVGFRELLREKIDDALAAREHPPQVLDVLNGAAGLLQRASA